MELSNVGESPLSEPVQLDRGVVNICLICREPDLETGACNKAILLSPAQARAQKHISKFFKQ